MPPTITATDQPLEKLTADAVVVAVGKGPDGPLPTPGAEAVDRLLGGRLFAALADLGARGGEDEVTRLASFGQGPFPVVAVTGLGAPGADGGYTPEAVRRAAGAASRALTGRRSLVSLLAAVGGAPDAERLHAVGEGSLLGAYEFTAYKSDLPANRPLPPQQITVVVPGTGEAETALRRARAVADAVALVRDLVNTPPNDLYPAELAARGAAAGEKLGLTSEILDEDALAAGGYGGILAVGSGSTRKPRLLRLTYTGKGARKKIALVGKGITFDSGGISIKPAAKMEDMKSDMAGAAAVIATVCLVAQLGLPVEVTATVPDGREPAQRDRLPAGRRRHLPERQEGRDHQHRRRGPRRPGRRHRACCRGPPGRADRDLDAHRRADWSRSAPARPASWAATTCATPSSPPRSAPASPCGPCRCRRSSAAGWTPPWPTSSTPTPTAWAACWSAGTSSRSSCRPDLPWAHIDIAGPSYNTGGPWGYTPKGGTGVPVRTLLATIEALIAD